MVLLHLTLYRAGLKGGPRLPECYRQSQAEVESNNRNKIRQTWGLPFGRALYFVSVWPTLRYDATLSIEHVESHSNKRRNGLQCLFSPALYIP